MRASHEYWIHLRSLCRKSAVRATRKLAVSSECRGRARTEAFGAWVGRGRKEEAVAKIPARAPSEKERARGTRTG